MFLFRYLLRSHNGSHIILLRCLLLNHFVSRLPGWMYLHQFYQSPTDNKDKEQHKNPIRRIGDLVRRQWRRGWSWSLAHITHLIRGEPEVPVSIKIIESWHLNKVKRACLSPFPSAIMHNGNMYVKHRLEESREAD